MRRLRRRASAASHLYCATNGCASYLELDPPPESHAARSAGTFAAPTSHPASRGAGSPRSRRPASAILLGHPPLEERSVTPTVSLDRARLGRLMADEIARFAADHPALGGAPRARERQPARRRADALDGQVGRALPAVRRDRVRRPFRLRRRPRLRRLLPRRHGRHGRPRPGADDRRRRTPAAPRRHAHAPDRGRRVGRRGADPTVRCRIVAVRVVGVRCQSLGAPSRAPHQRPLQGRRPRPLLPRVRRRGDRDPRRCRAGSSPSAVPSARRSTWPRPPGSSSSTTSMASAAALADGDVAAVLIEPALTNVGIVLPEPGYLEAVREITRRPGPS